MEDTRIVDLYWQRSEAAIEETEQKYGPYCRTIAYNILANQEDTEECVEDTYMSAWNAMPDKRPSRLSPFLGRITRNLALDRVDERNRQKRGGGETAICLEELSDCIPSGYSLDAEIEARELGRQISGFVKQLPEPEKSVFIARYFFMAPIGEIAEKRRFSQSKVKVMLYNTRKKLLRHLQKEGLCQIL